MVTNVLLLMSPVVKIVQTANGIVKANVSGITRHVMMTVQMVALNVVLTVKLLKNTTFAMVNAIISLGHAMESVQTIGHYVEKMM